MRSPLLGLGLLLAAAATDGAVVINTWPFTHATSTAFALLTTQPRSKTPSLDAITGGCHACEVEQCDFTVGYGGSPDTNGETTLDAMILDGSTLNMGAVARLRRVKEAIQVARAVMEHSTHSILAGDGALEFAKMMGFRETSLSTAHSKAMHKQWQQDRCQPNYFRNVRGQNDSCPPYVPIPTDADLADANVVQGDPDDEFWLRTQDVQALTTRENHDTIGMIALSNYGDMAAGTSSNGANHKIAGRVGDAAIPGAGAYVDSRIGGAAATGDGDVMMRFLPSFHAVQDMGNGIHPRVACERALTRIAEIYPDFKGGLVCLNKMGEYGAAGYGWDFSFTVQTSEMLTPQIVQVTPLALA